MSELKVFDVGLGQYCEDGSPCVIAFDADRNPRLLNEKVYLKSEADKVIAEKDAKIAELKDEIVKQEAENRGLKDENARLMSRPCYVCKEEQVKALENKFQELEGGTLILYNENNLRHNKYKRCLAMAEWCDEVMMSCELRGYNIHRIWARKHKWAMRWKYKWLELAEKFKEA